MRKPKVEGFLCMKFHVFLCRLPPSCLNERRKSACVLGYSGPAVRRASCSSMRQLVSPCLESLTQHLFCPCVRLVDQILTYPIEMYVARHVLDVSVFQTMLGKGPTSSVRHYGITVGIWALTMTLALSTDNLGSILEIFGAFGASVSPSVGGVLCVVGFATEFV